MAKVLIADDEQAIRNSLELTVKYEGHQVIQAKNGAEALIKLAEHDVDVAFLDIKMPEVEGIEVLAKARPTCPDTIFVIVSAHASVKTAVEATKQGAYEVIEKPIDYDRLLLVLRNALAQKMLARENRALRVAFQRDVEILGESKAIRDVVGLVLRVASTEARVLITGENGTGKELVARAVHRHSKRPDGPFVAVNCAALPATLIESELFGHEAGAFTGATQTREGKFEAADGGTLFLDEIGDMPPDAQAKLLRALEDGAVIRIGSNRPIKVNVRVLAATNQDIAALIKKGAFREDLFFRLNVFPIRVPSLRQHKDDISILAPHFAREFCAKNGVPRKKISSEGIDVLKSYDWPGNVRELRNFVERITIVSDSAEIDAEEMRRYLKAVAAEPSVCLDVRGYKAFREATDRLFLEASLRRSGFRIKTTAEAIGLPRAQLYRWLDRFGMMPFVKEQQAMLNEQAEEEGEEAAEGG